MAYTIQYVGANGAHIDFTAAARCIISDISGLTENYISVAESQGINQVGSTIQGQSVQPKNIVINGEIIGDTRALRKKMLEVIAPTVPGQLIFNDEWGIDVVPTVTPIIQRNIYNAKFQFTLRAAYPFWRKKSSKITRISGYIPLFRFPWNISDPNPFRFSRREESAFTTITNGGNVPAEFKVIFFARSPLTAPQIIKVPTREFIRIDKELQAGEQVTVDMTGGEVTVTSMLNNAETDYFGYLDIDSSLFLLDVGDNVLRDQADTNSDGLSTLVVFRETVSGVWI